eukprot:CAMPEP_0198666378 /NCGR_PEP_ID=MMETSP1467-20131203/64406_1 /TAXON_ID=1462469 /ORGANISM="unid. sp., Strain CCMP2135" /LENGTH=283 /DNA_ID=CAMNT_0044403023 /DNA_START=1 /DNA_END=852 /DNA_ORIENTATION=+
MAMHVAMKLSGRRRRARRRVSWGVAVLVLSTNGLVVPPPHRRRWTLAATMNGRHLPPLDAPFQEPLFENETFRVERASPSVRLPTKHGEFSITCFVEYPGGYEHVALTRGLEENDDVPLLRLHSECATGDLFGSRRCDCGEQLERAMQMIAQEKNGVILYLRGHEGRGIGLGAKLRAYALQDQGRDTVQANEDLHLPVDARSYDAAVGILKLLEVRAVRILTNNPTKINALTDAGIDVVGRVPIVSVPNDDNLGYLETKQRKMGHLYSVDQDDVMSSESEQDG